MCERGKGRSGNIIAGQFVFIDPCNDVDKYVKITNVFQIA